MTDITKADVFKELQQSVRHYGTMRFTMLTVFMTANGSLLLGYFSQTSNIPRVFLAFGGFWLALVFLILEVVLSFNMARLGLAAKGLAGEAYPGAFAHRRGPVLWLVRLTIPSVHILLALFWACQFLHPYQPPKDRVVSDSERTKELMGRPDNGDRSAEHPPRQDPPSEAPAKKDPPANAPPEGDPPKK